MILNLQVLLTGHFRVIYNFYGFFSFFLSARLNVCIWELCVCVSVLFDRVRLVTYRDDPPWA